MKSFFKKLAFVMAMAMVVSLAAPAAAHADGAIVIGDGEVSPRVPVDAVITLTEGEEKDLCFLGAPSNWRELEWAWTSDKEEVATVDVIDGIVTAVAEGIATITLTMEGYDPVSVKVVVEAEKEEAAFDLVQVSDSVIEIQFPAATAYTANDVQFLIAYDYNGKEISFPWKLKSKALNSDKTAIVLTSDGLFRDADKFKVVVGNLEPEYITVEVAEPTTVKLIAKDDKLKADAIMDKYTDDSLHFTFKLMSGDIDVTATYLEFVETFEYVVTPYDATKANYIIGTQNNDLSYDVQFYEAELGAEIQVKASYKLSGTNAVSTPIESEKLPIGSDTYTPWALVGVVGWAIVGPEQKAKNPVAWQTGTIEIPADHTEGTGNYYVALKLLDNRGKTYVTNAQCVEDGANTYVNDPSPFKDNLIIRFYPLNNNDVLLSGSNGQLKVYKECTTGYYVGCIDTTGNERYIWAADIKVIAGKQLESVKTADNALTVVTNTEFDETANRAATTKKTEITAMTQYTNTALALKYDVDDTYFKYEFVTEDKAKDAFSITTADNKVYLTVNGANLADVEKAYVDVKVKVTEVESNITKETNLVRVNIINPEVGEYDEVSRFMYNTYEKVTIKASDVTVASKDAVNGVVTTTVNLQKTYNGTPVANFNESEVTLITHKDQIEKTYTQEGDTYVVVRDPSGEIYTAVDFDGENIKIELTSATEGKLALNKEGNFTVEVVTVRFRKEDTTENAALTSIRSDYTTGKVSFKVSNGFDDISYNGTKTTAYTGTMPADEADFDDLVDIVVATLKWKKGSAEWAPTEAMITGIDAVVLGNNVIIKNVHFKVPYKDADTSYYYTDSYFGVNVAITVTAPAAN